MNPLISYFCIAQLVWMYCTLDWTKWWLRTEVKTYPKVNEINNNQRAYTSKILKNHWIVTYIHFNNFHPKALNNDFFMLYVDKIISSNSIYSFASGSFLQVCIDLGKNWVLCTTKINASISSKGNTTALIFSNR